MSARQSVFDNMKASVVAHALGYGMFAGVQPAEVSLANPAGWWEGNPHFWGNGASCWLYPKLCQGLS